MTLKRDAQMPLYQQLANEIKAQIASGELHQNEQLMTEMEMSSRRPMATAILPDMSTMD